MSRVFRWLGRSAALVIACVSAIILGYAAGVIIADINDSNSSAPPPTRNPTIDTVVTPTRSLFPWLAVLIPVAIIVLLVLFRKRRPVKWMLRRAKAAAQTYSLPLPPELTAPIVVSPVVVPKVSVGSQAVAAPMAVTVAAATTDVTAVTAVTTSDDNNLLCVLTFRDEPAVDQGSKRTNVVTRGVAASRSAIEEGFRNAAVVDPAEPGVARQIVDVISMFGANEASAERAYEASVELGRWIENDFGLRLLVTTGHPMLGRPAQDQGGATDAGNSSVFFNSSATKVDMHGLVPLAVYARVDLPVAQAKPTPIEPVAVLEPVVPVAVVEPAAPVEPVAVVVAVVAQPAVARQVVARAVDNSVKLADMDESVACDDVKISTMFDMLNELLAIGEPAPELASPQFAPSR